MYIKECTDNIKTNWKDIILKYDFTKINKFLEEEVKIYKNEIKIFPPKKLVFNAFNFFNKEKLKVVIIGQDPYINEGEAMGLSFSVPHGIKLPPSLKNILKELTRSLKIIITKNKGDLTEWSKQGVLLLNKALTVRQHKSNSHRKIWVKFTEYIINYISNNLKNIVFILWGNNAMALKPLIDNKKHYILSCGHPSPLNRKRDFIGSNHFVDANKYLKEHQLNEINWKI